MSKEQKQSGKRAQRAASNLDDSLSMDSDEDEQFHSSRSHLSNSASLIDTSAT